MKSEHKEDPTDMGGEMPGIDIEGRLEEAFWQILSPAAERLWGRGLSIVSGYSEHILRSRPEGETPEEEALDISRSSLPEVAISCVNFEVDSDRRQQGAVSYEIIVALESEPHLEGGEDAVELHRQREAFLWALLRGVRRHHLAGALDKTAQVKSIQWTGGSRGYSEDENLSCEWRCQVMILDPLLAACGTGC